MPTTSPDVGFNDSQIFASWNGATNVTQWALATGESTDDLSVGDSFQRTGFESNSTYSSDNTFIAAVALNRDGDCLGVSRPYFASNQSVSDRAIACSSLSNVQVAAATDSDDDDDDSSASSPSLAINIVLSIFLMAVFPLS